MSSENKPADPAAGAGVYHTPKAALDAVMANPPMGEPTAGTGALPPLDLPSTKPFTTASLASIPELGIEFHAYHTKDYYKFMCWWHNDQDPVGHVYELTVKEWGILAASDGVPKWRALAMSGGKTLFSLESSSKRLAIECGLTAMRRYLIRGHRAAWRTWRRAEAAKQQADGVEVTP